MPVEEVWMVVAGMFIRDIRDVSGTLPESCVSGPNRKLPLAVEWNGDDEAISEREFEGQFDGTGRLMNMRFEG